MEHQHSPDPEPAFVRSPAPDQNRSHARIDAYLTRTCAPLFASLPYEEAAAQRSEMQAHLESLAAARLELGFAEIEAVTLALHQFGKEQSVVQAWKQECEETKVEADRGTFWSAIRPIVAYSALNGILFPMLILFYMFIENGKPHISSAVGYRLVIVAMIVFFSEYSLFPAFLGFQAGRRARGKVLAASLLAMPFIVGLCQGISLYFYNGFHLLLPPPGIHDHLTLAQEVMPSWINFGFGVLGAGAALLRRSRRARRLAGNR